MFRQCEHHPAGCRWSCFWCVYSKAAGWIFAEQRSLHGVCFLDFPCTGNWFSYCQIRQLVGITYANVFGVQFWCACKRSDIPVGQIWEFHAWYDTMWHRILWQHSESQSVAWLKGCLAMSVVGGLQTNLFNLKVKSQEPQLRRTPQQQHMSYIMTLT